MSTLTLPVMGIARHRLATDGAGVTTLVVSQGCPLRCQYCINPYTWDPARKARRYTPEELLETLKIDDLYFQATGGGVTFGGGEPLLHSAFFAEFCRIAPKEWTINFETSLNIPAENLQKILPFAHTLIVDIKDRDPEIYRQYTKASMERVTENLIIARDTLAADAIHIRVPLIPGYNTPAHQQESEKALRALGFSNIELFSYRTDRGK